MLFVRKKGRYSLSNTWYNDYRESRCLTKSNGAQCWCNWKKSSSMLLYTHKKTDLSSNLNIKVLNTFRYFWFSNKLDIMIRVISFPVFGQKRPVLFVKNFIQWLQNINLRCSTKSDGAQNSAKKNASSNHVVVFTEENSNIKVLNTFRYLWFTNKLLDVYNEGDELSLICAWNANSLCQTLHTMVAV